MIHRQIIPHTFNTPSYNPPICNTTDTQFYVSRVIVFIHSLYKIRLCEALLDGLARAEIWLADGTFSVVPTCTVFFQLYAIHF